MMKQIWKNIRYFMIFCLGGLVGVFCVEGALYGISHSPLGYVLPLKDPQLGGPDKDLGFANIPGASGMWTKENRAWIEINSLGLRDKEIDQQSDNGVFRVVLLGDSITEALQVPHHHTFEDIAERALQKQGYNIEIANLALSGAGPMRQLLRLEHTGVPLTPKMALFMVDIDDFLGQELVNNAEFPTYSKNEHGEMVRFYGYRNRFSQRHIDTIYGKAFIGALRISHIFRALNERRKGTVLEILGLRLPNMSFLFLSKQATKIEGTRKSCVSDSLQNSYNLWAKHEPSLHWEALQKLLRDTRAVGTEHDVDIAMGIYIKLPHPDCPEEHEVREKLVRVVGEQLKAHNIKLVDWNAELVQTMDRPLLEHSDIHELRGFGTNLGNGHLNYRGHRIFAETLQNVLQPALPLSLE